ncbi:selenium metabolism-associated LysR family transcriptional regulator [Desulfomarina sp.]
MDTRQLKIFATVYKHRSFTRAAEELFTSQPTISEHIRNLEERLGCRLFDRLGRSILPTAEAEMLYPRALTILEDLTRLEEEIMSVGKTVSGRLLLGASTIPGAYILPRLAAAFKNRYPEISFEIRISDSAAVVQSILDNDLLIGIVGAKLKAKSLQYHVLTEDELVLIAAEKNPVPETISPEELCSHPFIMRERGSGTRRTIESILEQSHLTTGDLNTSATLGSSTAVKEAVKADLGLSFISRYAIRDELKRGCIKTISIPDLNTKRAFYIVLSNKRTLPHHYNIFLQTIINPDATD